MPGHENPPAQPCSPPELSGWAVNGISVTCTNFGELVLIFTVKVMDAAGVGIYTSHMCGDINKNTVQDRLTRIEWSGESYNQSGSEID